MFDFFPPWYFLLHSNLALLLFFNFWYTNNTIHLILILSLFLFSIVGVSFFISNINILVVCCIRLYFSLYYINFHPGQLIINYQYFMSLSSRHIKHHRRHAKLTMNFKFGFISYFNEIQLQKYKISFFFVMQ